VSSTASPQSVAEQRTAPVLVAGHQPHYLPWIGYFNKIEQSSRFCLVDSVQFVKKWFQNRNKIRTKAGDVWLTVPVKTHDRFEQPIADVVIDNATPWRRKHWRTIELAYKDAPFFKQYADFFADVYAREWSKLVDLNEHVMLGVMDFLNIKKDVVRSSTFAPQGQKTDLLIDICRKTGADGYLSGTGGAKSYVQLEKFEAAGLLHEFQQFTHPVYPQIHGGFVPRMAIVDLLFNVGPDAERLVKEASHHAGETSKAS